MKKDCIFCLIVQREEKTEIIIESEKSIAIYDKNKLSDGHSLIISKDHYENLFEISHEVWNDSFILLKKLVEKLKKDYSPKGFNLISNIGKVAYQTINHSHIHIIPKYDKKSGLEVNVK